MTDPTTDDNQRRVKLALKATFAGEPVKNFRTDELLMLIGSLIQQLEAEHRDLDHRFRAPYVSKSKYYTPKQLAQRAEKEELRDIAEKVREA